MANEDEKSSFGAESNREAPYSDEDAEESDVQAILDESYDQLDRFVLWLEGYLELDTRTSQQDCFNAEFLLDYLASTFRKSATDINEFELRWFLFSHYIRKAMADAETEERLPDSLLRFFHFLEAEDAYTLPKWLAEALSERTYYLSRRQEYSMLDRENELVWQQGYRRWSAELEDHLDARCLWLPADMGKEMRWQEQAGWREGTLREEANQRWQEERAEWLAEGWDFEALRARLTDSYLMWLDTPQERLDNETPREVVAQERLERADMGSESEEE
jgi:hypothetical protein